MNLQDRLRLAGVPEAMCRTFEERRHNSVARLDELQRRLRQVPAIAQYPNLAIYAAGSYARREASSYSDIDLFFIHDDTHGPAVEDPRLKGIRVMSGVIREIEEGMEFPPPSNDGQFLNIVMLNDVLSHLGGPEDDHKNHFTARMLLLLESSPVYGSGSYDRAIEVIIDAYFRDYEDHAETFRPTFLVNDIIRFWKTLCLNYEHRRNQAPEARKLKQKIRNFKLGYSRLLTCWATISLLSSFNNLNQVDLIAICKMSPVERLLLLHERVPTIKDPLTSALVLYHWFLEKTALPPDGLEQYFSDRENRVFAFKQSKKFGDDIYQITKMTAEHTGNLRYLVI